MREVDDVGDCGNDDGCTFFKKPSGDRIGVGLFVRTV